MQALVLLVSAPSLHNQSFLLGNPPHTRASASSIARTLKTAHPDITISSTSFPIFPLVSLDFLSLDQVLDRLVSPSSIRYRTSTGDLSPGSLPGVLLLSNGTLLLEVGFTLRCLQRLSLPNTATLLWD